eukprot:c17859_g1_i1 orf=161-475(-)
MTLGTLTKMHLIDSSFVELYLCIGDTRTFHSAYSRFAMGISGNRSTHYRCSRTGFTLVHFLMHIPNVVRSFKSKVEACVPGMYDWFAEESLHITIRALLDNLLV